MPAFIKRTRALFAGTKRLTPPWDQVEVVERTGGIEDGARDPSRCAGWPSIAITSPAGKFRDVQVSGPFARWEHTHRFEPGGPDA